MPCYHPITAYRPRDGGPLCFTANKQDADELQVPCGQCFGCRLRRSREWATRCMHESQMHKYNSFCTFTYDKQNLPANSSLHYYDLQCLYKRIRKALGKVRECPTAYPTLLTQVTPSRHGVTPHTPFSYYTAGEYGEQNGRPHYHSIFFNLDFNDRKYHRTLPSGAKLYKSETLEKFWPLGFSAIGNVTFESCAYVARYIMKKQTGQHDSYYETLDLDTGEIYRRKAEFNQMSKKPPIGKTWMDKYAADIYSTGKVILKGGHKLNPPRAYDRLYESVDSQRLEELKYERLLESLKQIEHHTPERLAVQEAVARAKTRPLKRQLQKPNQSQNQSEDL